MDRREVDAYKTAEDFCKALVQKFERALENDPQVSRLNKMLAEEEIKEIIEFLNHFNI